MKLLEPLQAGPLRLANRLVFPAFETNWATADGHVTPELVHLWSVIAEGGAGLIVVQCTNVNPDLSLRHTPFITSLHDDSYIAEYGRAIRAVKERAPQVKLALQLADKSLMARHLRAVDMSPVEIKQVVEYLAQGARRARDAGFDAVEFHSAHNYTLAEFLSKRGNERPEADPYGRSRAGRLRIHQELIVRTRELVGAFPIIYRFNGDDFIAGGNTIKDGMEIARALEAAGVDVLSVSAGGRRDDGPDGYSPTRVVPRAYYEDACNVHIAGRIKREVHIPVITAGKIGTVELAEQVLAEGRADLVAMGRQLFHDPFTLKKTLEGRAAEISKCSWCRKCHITYLAGGPGLCPRRSWRENYAPAKYRDLTIKLPEAN